MSEQRVYSADGIILCDSHLIIRGEDYNPPDPIIAGCSTAMKRENTNPLKQSWKMRAHLNI